jgi:hypothetical protein
MASWYARLLFDGDRLVDIGIHDAVTEAATEALAAGPEADPSLAPGARDITSVLVSGYALYGRLRGYYAIGVAHFGYDPERGRFVGSASALHHAEPTASLSPAQRRQIGAWLAAHAPEAWASSLDGFRRTFDVAGAPPVVPAPLPAEEALVR